MDKEHPASLKRRHCVLGGLNRSHRYQSAIPTQSISRLYGLSFLKTCSIVLSKKKISVKVQTAKTRKHKRLTSYSPLSTNIFLNLARINLINHNKLHPPILLWLITNHLTLAHWKLLNHATRLLLLHKNRTILSGSKFPRPAWIRVGKNDGVGGTDTELVSLPARRFEDSPSV